MSNKPAKIGRRDILEGGLGFGLAVCLPRCTVAGQGDTAADFPKEGDLLIKAGDTSRRPLTVDDVARDTGPLMVRAMDPASKVVREGSRLNAILVVRIDASQLGSASQSYSAAGVVAYSAICTHQGCEVSEWIAELQLLSCPCHDSVFDPKDDGKVSDGPAPRSLPALPLKIRDGELVVAAPFTSRPGFS
jgi:Rieske Fe-S protein